MLIPKKGGNMLKCVGGYMLKRNTEVIICLITPKLWFVSHYFQYIFRSFLWHSFPIVPMADIRYSRPILIKTKFEIQKLNLIRNSKLTIKFKIQNYLKFIDLIYFQA